MFASCAIPSHTTRLVSRLYQVQEPAGNIAAPFARPLWGRCRFFGLENPLGACFLRGSVRPFEFFFFFLRWLAVNE